MPAIIPVIAAVAGSAAAGAGIAAGIGLTAFAATAFDAAFGFVVSTAINQLGSRLVSQKPKSSALNQDAAGRAVTLRSSIASHKVIYGTAKVSGPLVYVATTQSGTGQATPAKVNKMLHLVTALAGHEVEEIGDVYFNDRVVTLQSASGGFVTSAPYKASGGPSYAFVKKMLGADDQEADPTMLANCPGWTADHRLRGIAYLYVRLEYNPDIFPTGIPNVSAVVKGKKVYDPRDDTTAWSANTALCVRDYLASDYGFGCSDDEINDTYFIAAANLCDEDVTTATGTEDRYTCNGVIDTASAPLDNLAALVTSCAGAVTYVQGQFRLHGASYDSPAGDIDETILAGPVKVRTRAPRKELFNAVKGTYVDPTKSWQPTDFPPVTNSTYETEDGGEQVFRDIELPFTTSSATAQRLAKIALEKARQGIVVEMAVMHHAMKFAVFDVVNVTNTQMGWSDKAFRILKWSTTGMGPVNLVLQEESSASYDWDSGEETTTDTAPDTDLPDPFTVEPPGALTVTESLYVTRDGLGVKAKASLSWLESADAFLKEYQAEYKPTSATDYTVLPRTSDTATEILDITPGDYDFRVKAISQLGVSSAYTSAMKTIIGLSAPPTGPQNLTISAIGGMALMRWTQSQDLDVLRGGKIVFRHSPDTSAEWSGSTSIGDAYPGDSTVAVLPLKPGKYFAKMVDSSGIQSTDTASVTTAQATVLAFANLDGITEDPAFAGTFTNSAVNADGQLVLGDWIVDGFPWFGTRLVTTQTTGTYYFSAGIDLGAAARVRLTSRLNAIVVNTLDLIDDRTDPIDEWTSFDGDDTADADAIVYVRTTDDDPAGTPTWGDWQRLDSAEFFNRAFEFKLVMSTVDPAFNIQVNELSVSVDEVV
jgi:hypothetical protein